VVAKVRVFLIANFLGGWLTTLLGPARVIIDTELAYMEFGTTGCANIEPAQWKTEAR